jgi:hypothetical protein
MLPRSGDSMVEIFAFLFSLRLRALAPFALKNFTAKTLRRFSYIIRAERSSSVASVFKKIKNEKLKMKNGLGHLTPSLYKSKIPASRQAGLIVNLPPPTQSPELSRDEFESGPDHQQTI